ncbi:MAG: AtpZ/AtpI family protein [Roseburia sp.]|nr:AtpZ/AtpI family protein [Roseburia sp.]MCM1279848.1 AtpZ/AtpI family protein [Robinsoniella sp.]
MKYRKSVYRSLAMITQFGINMLVPIFLCSFLGMYLDKWLGTGFFMVILFFMGALGGFRNIYILSKRIYEKKEKRDVHDKKDKTVK